MYALNVGKKIAVIGAMVEGNSIRSVERMMSIHRDTIMRLVVRVKTPPNPIHLRRLSIHCRSQSPGTRTLD